jgi:DNA-binding response OmpR family regulator
LRRKLDDHPPGSLIRTLHGKGYMIPRVSGGTPNLQAAD